MVLKIFKIVDLESGGFSFLYVKSSNLSDDTKCEVLTAMLLNIWFFWDVILCHRVCGPLFSKGLQCLHLKHQTS